MKNKNMMDTEIVSLQIEKIKMYIEEENKILEKIKNGCTSILNSYTSIYQDKLNSNNTSLINEMNATIVKRKLYIKTLSEYVAAYESSATNTTIIFNNLGGNK